MLPAPDDHRDQVLLVRPLGLQLADLAALAQHHGAVGDFHELRHVVADHDNAMTLWFLRSRITSSTCAVSRTPSAAVGSSRMTIRRPQRMARAIAMPGTLRPIRPTSPLIAGILTPSVFDLQGAAPGASDLRSGGSERRPESEERRLRERLAAEIDVLVRGHGVD